ncbi:MAG: cytochrome c3 family protein [Desulfovibrio sp.]|nr:cytochrome c3 family protein [Desulfovibrio sp.]
MKHMGLFFLTIALLFATHAQADNLKMLTDAIKKPITIEAGKSLRMNVVFNHTSHRGINCFTCHHMKSDKGRYVSCSECHKGVGRSAEPASRFMAFHAKDSQHSCYACHLEKAEHKPVRYGKVFYNCRPCHMGQNKAVQGAGVR